MEQVDKKRGTTVVTSLDRHRLVADGDLDRDGAFGRVVGGLLALRGDLVVAGGLLVGLVVDAALLAGVNLLDDDAHLAVARVAHREEERERDPVERRRGRGRDPERAVEVDAGRVAERAPRRRT